MKPVFIICLLSLLTANLLFAQTTTIVSGNWSDATVWSSGAVPGGATNTTVLHPLIINQNIIISSGDYTFAKNATDAAGAPNYNLEIGSGGVVEITSGTTTFGGTGIIDNFSTLIIRSGATLVLGPTSVGNNVTLLVEAGGTLIINGDLDNGNNGGTFTIEGLVYVNGNFDNGGNAELIGTGDIITTGSLTNQGSSETFDTRNDCSTGPCSGRNLCGFTNSISPSQARCVGTPAAPLTGITSASSPVYLWEYSTTSSTNGFTPAPAPNNTSGYSPGTPSQTTWFRRKVTSGGCTGTSVPVQVTIVPLDRGWIGGTNSNWHTGSNWCQGVPPTSASDAVIPPVATNMPIISTGNQNCRDLTIHPGATVTITGGTLAIYGDVENLGTFTPGLGTVSFVGSTSQSFTSGALTFNNLVVNNSAGVVFDALATITNQITLTAGTVNLSGNNISLINSSSTTAVTRTSGWLYNGALTRSLPSSTFTQNGFFPMGTSTDYRPFSAARSGSSGNAGTLRVSHTGVSSTSTVNVADPSTSTTIVRRQESSWNVSNTGLTGGSWSITAGGTNFGTVGELADLRLMRATDVVGSHGTVSGNISPNENFLVSRTGLTPAQLTNTFHIGSVDAIQTPLPIRLLSFTGLFFDGNISIDWATASEDNFDHFVLERSTDGLNFDFLGRISGTGGHNIPANYSYLDESVQEERYYYRLKIIDVDESFEYSKIIVVNASDELGGITIFPNPISNQAFTLKLNDGSYDGRLSLCDEVGKILLDISIKDGNNEIPLAPEITNGVYFARIVTGSSIGTIKLIVAR